MYHGLLWGATEKLSLRPHDKFRNGVEAFEEQNILEVKNNPAYYWYTWVTMLVSVRSQTNVKSMLQIQQSVDLRDNNRNDREKWDIR